MAFSGIGQGPNIYNNWSALMTAQAGAGIEDTREKKRKDSTESKRMSTATIKGEHKQEASQIAFEEFTKAQVLKGTGPGR